MTSASTAAFRLEALHPLTVVALTLGPMLIGLALPLSVSGFVAFVVVLVPVAAWGGKLRAFLGGVVRVFLPIGLFVFLIQGVASPPAGPLVLRIGPVSLYQTNILAASTFTSNLVLMLAGFYLFSLCIDSQRLMGMLTAVHVPHSLAYVAAASVGVLVHARSRAKRILDAQRCRGLRVGGGPITRARSLIPLVAPFVLSSLTEAESRSLALEVRGMAVRGKRTLFTPLIDSEAQCLFRRTMFCLVVLAWVAGSYYRLH